MEVRSEKLIAVRCGREDSLNRLYHILPEYATAKILTVKHKTPRRLSSSGCSVNGFTQCHACVVQTTTRYAGVHKKLYKKITNRITIRMFKSIVKKKGDFNGK